MRRSSPLTSERLGRQVLRIEDLGVNHGRVPALSGVSIHVSPGEVVSIIGSNGAGKTTLLSTIAGLLKPVRGVVLFEGQSIAGAAPETIVGRGVSLVPEGRRIFTKLTVMENLQLGLTVAPRQSREAAIERVLEYFPALTQFLPSSAGRLSGGEQQQLAIARALLAQPKLLLLDEPSLGLAPLVIEVVFATLLRLREEGMTVLLVEQFAEKAREISDRTYVLRTGQVSLEITAGAEISREDLEHAYFGFERATT
jgi:branched-chain amino acid transport system ATP-binding protein